MPNTPVPAPPAGGGNRTDLLVPGGNPAPAPGQGQPNGQPVTVPTGLPYGENQQLAQAQAAVPLPAAPTGAPPPPPNQPAAPVDMQSAMAAAANMPMPNRGGLTRPSERPGEPVTAGLPMGPMPSTGQPPQQAPNGSISAMLAKMAAATGSAALSQLAGRATAVGQ